MALNNHLRLFYLGRVGFRAETQPTALRTRKHFSAYDERRHRIHDTLRSPFCLEHSLQTQAHHAQCYQSHSTPLPQLQSFPDRDPAQQCR